MLNPEILNNKLGNNYSFTTEEIKRDTFYFDLEGDEPIKLGDGSFGVVYQVHDETLQKFAVKLLYENQALEQALIQPRLDNEILQDFCSYFNILSLEIQLLKKVTILFLVKMRLILNTKLIKLSKKMMIQLALF